MVVERSLLDIASRRSALSRCLLSLWISLVSFYSSLFCILVGLREVDDGPLTSHHTTTGNSYLLGTFDM